MTDTKKASHSRRIADLEERVAQQQRTITSLLGRLQTAEQSLRAHDNTRQVAVAANLSVRALRWYLCFVSFSEAMHGLEGEEVDLAATPLVRSSVYNQILRELSDGVDAVATHGEELARMIGELEEEWAAEHDEAPIDRAWLLREKIRRRGDIPLPAIAESEGMPVSQIFATAQEVDAQTMADFEADQKKLVGEDGEPL